MTFILYCTSQCHSHNQHTDRQTDRAYVARCVAMGHILCYAYSYCIVMWPNNSFKPQLSHWYIISLFKLKAEFSSAKLCCRLMHQVGTSLNLIVFHCRHSMMLVAVLYRTTAACTSAFLESFQKLADMALGTRGKHKQMPIVLITFFITYTVQIFGKARN